MTDDDLEKGFQNTGNLNAGFQMRSNVPGQMPRLTIPQSLTNPPTIHPNQTAQARLMFTEPVLSKQSITRNLGMDRTTEKQFQSFVGEQLEGASNEAALRIKLAQHLMYNGTEPALRRALMQRTLSYYKGQGYSQANDARIDARARGLRKGDDMESFHIIEKAQGPFYGPQGGKYKDAAHTQPWKAAHAKEGSGSKKYSYESDLVGFVKKVKAKAAEINRASPTVLYPGQDTGRAMRAIPQFQDWTKQDHLDAIAHHTKASRAGTYVGIGGSYESRDATASAHEDMAKLHAHAVRSGLKGTRTLEKAQARGGSYHRRVPKDGGGFRYYYDEEKYRSRDDAHVSGKEAKGAACRMAVDKCVGDKGADKAALKTLAGKYGADLVASTIRSGVEGGTFEYDGKTVKRKKAKSE